MAEKYMGSVKVGPKGQIVIPKEVREMFGIAPGDALILLADGEKGIAIHKYSVFEKISQAIFQGETVYPEHTPAENKDFAGKILELKDRETGFAASAPEGEGKNERD